MRRILHIVNAPPGPAVDGGTHREAALADYLRRQGAETLIVRDDDFSRSRAGRLRRLPRLVREVRSHRPDLVALCYPSYPFYWQHKVTPYFFASLAFACALRRAADRDGFTVAIDIRDLPALQYQDLGFSLQMRPSTLRWFDSFIFRRAECLWVCSESLARTVIDRYRVPEERTLTVLNGYTIQRDPSSDPRSGILKFAYAGSLNRERGVQKLITAFMDSGVEAQLHLCGPYGEWVTDLDTGSRVVYHGSLTDDRAADVLADCDVGLIPYPQTGYYHLAFATKLAFYLGLGMPVLCSDVHETGSHVDRLGVGLRWDIDDFASAFHHIAADRAAVQRWRERVMALRADFAWTAIYARAIAQTPVRTGAPGGSCP